MGSSKQHLTFTNTWSDCSPGTGQPQLSWQWGQPISNKGEESDVLIFGTGPHILTFLTPSESSCTGRGQALGCGTELGQEVSPRASPQVRSSGSRKLMGIQGQPGKGSTGVQCPVPGTDRCAIVLTHPPSPHRAGAWSNLFISSYQP